MDIDLNLLNQRSRNTLSDYLGIEFTEVGDNFLMAKVTLRPEHKQPLGIMHGGMSCVIAESVGSSAANFCVEANHYAVGLDINTNHIRSIKEGELIARATPFHIGKSTQVWGIEIKNAADQLISVNRLTMAVLSRNRNCKMQQNVV